MTRKRKYDANLPKNLTYREKYDSFYWRNPITGKEIPLGKIARRDAIAQTIEANNYIEQNYSPVALLKRIKEDKQPSVSFWIEKYLIILERREAGILSDNPPTFHEIRSLAGRMHEAEYGREFAQHLLGHKSAKMTAKYLDSRDGSYALIALPEQKTGY